MCVCVCFICCRNLCALCVLIYLRLVWFQGEIRKNNVRIEKYILCRYYTHKHIHTQMYMCVGYWNLARISFRLMLCISCWPLVHYSLLIRRVAQLASLAEIKDSISFFMLYIVYIIHMPHAPLSARKLGIDLPPLSPLLPLAARTASQPAASDVIWLLSTTRGSVVFPLPPYPVSFPTYFPPSPTCASFQRSSAYLIISANSFRDTYRSRSRAKFQNTQAVTLKIIAGLRQRRRRPQQ